MPQHKHGTPKKVWTDASWKKGEKSTYGWTDLFGTVKHYEEGNFDNINDAELAAINLAVADLGPNVKILTDSTTAQKLFVGSNEVKWEERGDIISDTLIRNYKESSRNK